MVCHLLFSFPLQTDIHSCILILHHDSGVNPGSSGHIPLRSTAQARKLFSAQCVLEKVLLGTTPLATVPDCSSDVGGPN